MKILVFDASASASDDLAKSFEANSVFEIVLATTLEDVDFALQQEPFDAAWIFPAASQEEFPGFGNLMEEKFIKVVGAKFCDRLIFDRFIPLPNRIAKSELN